MAQQILEPRIPSDEGIPSQFVPDLAICTSIEYIPIFFINIQIVQDPTPSDLFADGDK